MLIFYNIIRISATSFEKSNFFSLRSHSCFDLPLFLCGFIQSIFFPEPFSRLAHMEIICAIVHQLTRNLSPEEIECSGFDKYYVDHTLTLWPQAASGEPWSANFFQSKGNPITDLSEDMGAEQKARTTYDNILRLIKDPEIYDPIRFLREREIVHFQRFGESLRIVQDHLDSKNFYTINRSLIPARKTNKLYIPKGTVPVYRVCAFHLILLKFLTII